MRTSFSLAFFLRLLYPLIGRFETLLFQFRSRGTRERILISFRRSEKSRFFVKTANRPPLSVMLVLFCGFFRCFRRFGVFFELVFNSDCIRQKRECSSNAAWSESFRSGENKLHHRKARVYETICSRSLVSRSRSREIKIHRTIVDFVRMLYVCKTSAVHIKIMISATDNYYQRRRTHS